MRNYRIILCPDFNTDYGHLEESEKARVYEFARQLSNSAIVTGKPLGYLFFRKKKFNGKRLYFLIYEEWKMIVFVRISGKKDQTVTTVEVKQKLLAYKEFVREKLNDPNSFV